MIVKLVVDPGSTHMGKWDYIKELTDVAKEGGASAIKWQLFRMSKSASGLATNGDVVINESTGNVAFPRELFPKAVEYAKSMGIDCFASVFDADAIELVHGCGIQKIKLAYSQAFNLKLIRQARKLGMEIWASGDDISYPSYADIKLYCVPQYPIKPRISFHQECFDESKKAMDGFSSHIMGYKEDLRIMGTTGWQYLEKHITLDHDDIDCRDHWFALLPKELRELSKCLSA